MVLLCHSNAPQLSHAHMMLPKIGKFVFDYKRNRNKYNTDMVFFYSEFIYLFLIIY